MRRSTALLAWWLILFSAWTPRARAVDPTPTDAWVAQYLRDHPSYRGYLTPRPPYPLFARMYYEQGVILAQVTFAKEGPVNAVKLTKSSGWRTLDASTISFIKDHWWSTFGQEKTTTVPLDYRLVRRGSHQR